MAAIVPKLKPNKPLQIYFKKPNPKCTINTLTSTLKKIIPNIKEIKITSKKLPKNSKNKNLMGEPTVSPLKSKLQIQNKPKEKPDDIEIEYYPDKVKRNTDSKKIVLEPRHDYKIVASTNKRKRRTPRKDASSLKKLKTNAPSPENCTNELSFEDMIPSSIIHKIKDYKNMQKTQTDHKNDQTDPSDLKNTSKDQLDPKIQSKLACKINQRLNTPSKGLESDSDHQMQGIEDLINDESLTDEDFMEILTCPSPVWWEDPPDAYYTEEPIGRFHNEDNRSKTHDSKVPSKTTQPSEINPQDGTQNNRTEVTVATKTLSNKKLIEKRLNLENLLSSLKNNTVSTKIVNEKVRKISSDGSEFSVDGEDLVNSLQSIEIPIKSRNDEKIAKNDEVIGKTNDNEPNSNEIKDLNEISLTKESNTSNKNEIKTINKEIDNKSSIENKTVPNSSVEKKPISPRKSNRISPKKHQLTKYYSLKSKRPRIIKQNPRSNIIIETHIKTNINSQKTPEKKLNKNTNNVSKIKMAYLDLLQNSKIENNLTPKLRNNKTAEENVKTAEESIKSTEENVKSTEENLKNTEQYVKTAEEIAKTTELNAKENHKIETENIKTETILNNNTNDIKTKSINNIPQILPNLIKIPQNLTIESPKSIKSVTSDSTEANSEMDTISDTNIQYIDEYDGKKDDLVTVYQIISNNK